MKALLKYSIISLLILSSCSLKKHIVYKSNQNKEKIIIAFENRRKGYIKIDNKDSVPFRYEIERNRIDINDLKNVEIFVYRFTIDAKYDFRFPFGLYEVGQKRGAVLKTNDSITFVKQEINK